jgi:mycothiol synthase
VGALYRVHSIMPYVAVSPAGPADYPAACRALFAHRPAPDRDKLTVRALGLLAAGEIDPAGLLVARVGGKIVGAALSQLTPGNGAVVWPPRGDTDSVRLALAHAVVGRLRASGAKLAQSFAAPADRADLAPLEAAGFRRVARVEFLCRPVDPAADLAAFDPAASPVTFEPADATDPAVGDLIHATYDGTLDCPELNGTRTAAEVLAGYTSTDRPAWWRVLRGREPVGVVMLSAGKPGVLDLTYLGLVPAARGHGWGAALVGFALRHAALSAAEWVNLSVDARNRPALRLYEARSFRPYDSQDVCLWRPDW